MGFLQWAQDTGSNYDSNKRFEADVCSLVVLTMWPPTNSLTGYHKGNHDARVYRQECGLIKVERIIRIASL
jgi:hypothetical protein